MTLHDWKEVCRQGFPTGFCDVMYSEIVLTLLFGVGFGLIVLAGMAQYTLWSLGRGYVPWFARRIIVQENERLAKLRGPQEVKHSERKYIQ